MVDHAVGERRRAAEDGLDREFRERGEKLGLAIAGSGADCGTENAGAQARYSARKRRS